MADRDTLRLRQHSMFAEPMAAFDLAAMPCPVCHAFQAEPEVIRLDGGNVVAYCVIEHAKLHGWPWLTKPAPGGSPVTQE